MLCEAERERLRRRPVADQRADAVQPAHADRRLGAELRVVGDDHGLRGLLDHGARQLGLLQVVVHEAALGMDRADRQDRVARPEIAHERHGRLAEHRVVVGADLAAGQVHAVALAAHQRAGDLGAVRDDEEVAPRAAGRARRRPSSSRCRSSARRRPGSPRRRARRWRAWPRRSAPCASRNRLARRGPAAAPRRARARRGRARRAP